MASIEHPDRRPAPKKIPVTLKGGDHISSSRKKTSKKSEEDQTDQEQADTQTSEQAEPTDQPQAEQEQADQPQTDQEQFDVQQEEARQEDQSKSEKEALDPYQPKRSPLKAAGLDQHAVEEKRQAELAEEREIHNALTEGRKIDRASWRKDKKTENTEETAS